MREGDPEGSTDVAPTPHRDLRRAWRRLGVVVTVGLFFGLHHSRELHLQARSCRVDAHSYGTGRPHLAWWFEDGALETECVARDATDCVQPCEEHGDCSVKEGRCVPTLSAHCRESRDCRRWGNCHLVDGLCRRPKGLVDFRDVDVIAAPAPPPPGLWPMVEPEVDSAFCAAQREACVGGSAFCIVNTHPFPLRDPASGCYGADPS